MCWICVHGIMQLCHNGLKGTSVKLLAAVETDNSSAKDSVGMPSLAKAATGHHHEVNHLPHTLKSCSP